MIEGAAVDSLKKKRADVKQTERDDAERQKKKDALTKGLEKRAAKRQQTSDKNEMDRAQKRDADDKERDAIQRKRKEKDAKTLSKTNQQNNSYILDRIDSLLKERKNG